MKKQSIIVTLLSIACLVGCGAQNNGGNSKGGNGGNSSSQPSQQPYHFVIPEFGTYKFEAEDFDYSNWEPLSGYDFVTENPKASGGKYLSATDPDYTGGSAEFYLHIPAYSKVTLSVAFAQAEENISRSVDISQVYAFNVDNVNDFTLPSNAKTLAARDSEDVWELMTFNTEYFYEGEYHVTVLALENATVSAPSIDYIQVKASDASAAPSDPSDVLSEDDIPDNDMRNLQQYKYILEKDVYKYKTYATGADLSAPRGMKLRYDNLDAASKYYVQIAESEADLDAAAVRESTQKYYYFQNAKLGTKYYYRAATSEAGLASAEVKNITSTDQAPRVVYVPDVLNFRDIGGWESTLVVGNQP